MQLSINSKEIEDYTVINLQGEVNLKSSPDISDKFLTIFSKNFQEVIVDLSRVTSMDFSGIATLVEGLKWSNKMGKSFVLKSASNDVVNSLTLTKLETAFKMIP